MSKDKDKKKGKPVEEEAKTPENEAAENVTEQAPPEEKAPEQEVKPSSEAAELKDKFLRLAADFDNFKKRSKTEKDGIYQMAVADTVAKFLPVIDDMQRAYAAADGDSPLKKGVGQVVTKFSSVLEQLGVTPVGEKGEKFDVELHEAVMQGESDEFGEGEIIEVFEKGYKIGNRVVRYAKVKVNQ